MKVPERLGDPVLVESDQGIRPDSTPRPWPGSAATHMQSRDRFRRDYGCCGPSDTSLRVIELAGVRPGPPEDPRFVTNSARVAHRADLNALIGAGLSSLETDMATALLDRARIASARDFPGHPVLPGCDRWCTVTVRGGKMVALRPPVDLAGIEPVMGPVPAVVEHTDAILRELDRTNDTIAALRSRALV